MLQIALGPRRCPRLPSQQTRATRFFRSFTPGRRLPTWSNIAPKKMSKQKVAWSHRRAPRMLAPTPNGFCISKSSMCIRRATAPPSTPALNCKAWFPDLRQKPPRSAKRRRPNKLPTRMKNLSNSPFSPDGRAESVTGLDTLFPEQREAWQQWLRQFALAAVFPPGGVKRGQTWKSTEPEEAPSPIDRLQWEKNVTYVRDEPCSPAQLGETGAVAAKESQPETCAVILTKAVLKQKSSPKDTTPPDFKLHALHTMGNATGTNETISYIALRTGVLMRVTEDARQFMDVVIAKTDGTNQVHYNVDAASHSEVMLLAPTFPAIAPTPKP